ncbi:hypothetical protein O181_000774 [Austropuccinia psidii MF-1]|uniref:Uncharacterized protein n=1 Tax=Austropuccinia psidii MF-1 TaxID=1389203 RepID=A0A9Q3B961_9BASI|nr:hypothetical protein [Austropuccinia psidii MF-1]
MACSEPEDLEEDTLDTVVDGKTLREITPTLLLTFQFTGTQTGGLEGYGSSSSAPPTPQRSFSMKHVKQEVQISIPLGQTWIKFPEDVSQRDKLERSY